MTAKISIFEAAVLTRYVCPWTQLWQVPLVTTVRNENTDTLLLNHSHKHESLNTTYTVESTAIMRAHIDSVLSLVHNKEYIHNVYELPSIEPTIRYLQAAVGFPTKESWLKAIRQGNYNSWPLINVKNVARHFPVSEEPLKGHMRGQRQGVRSTKEKRWDANVMSVPVEATPHIHKGDIMIFNYDLKSTMYTNQTGFDPQISSLGNRYVVILHNVDSNLSWVEALKNNTGSKLILAQARALECMCKAGIVPKQ